jgi:hypothetical protein
MPYPPPPSLRTKEAETEKKNDLCFSLKQAVLSATTPLTDMWGGHLIIFNSQNEVAGTFLFQGSEESV